MHSKKAIYFATLTPIGALILLIPVPLLHIFDMNFVLNPREITPPFIAFFIIIVPTLFVLISRSMPDYFLKVFGVIVSGALANVSYRILIGPVPDYIHLPEIGYTINFPDIAIFSGLAVFLTMTAVFIYKEWRAG